VKIVADTNILVRAVMGDHPKQSPAAQKLLSDAKQVVMPAVALCELVWVLRKAYGLSPEQAAVAVRALTRADNAVSDGALVEAGLGVLDRGGDFADGAIAYDGVMSGADIYASFDKKALRLLSETGMDTLNPL
jgi:predicted nucleic-acid-binding protein